MKNFAESFWVQFCSHFGCGIFGKLLLVVTLQTPATMTWGIILNFMLIKTFVVDLMEATAPRISFDEHIKTLIAVLPSVTWDLENLSRIVVDLSSQKRICKFSNIHFALKCPRLEVNQWYFLPVLLAYIKVAVYYPVIFTKSYTISSKNQHSGDKKKKKQML